MNISDAHTAENPGCFSVRMQENSPFRKCLQANPMRTP